VVDVVAAAAVVTGVVDVAAVVGDKWNC